ncbi:MAG TPA: polyphosphate kinase 1, partial [Terriglobales bacterium]|nr:polyphosphate kinase 1 [Terriglobales bacterium]
DECSELARETHEFLAEQSRCWNEQLRPALAQNGIRVLKLDELDGPARDFVREYCERELDSLLTPVTIDPAHPFPRVINKALCQAVLLKRRRRSAVTYMGVITVPRALPRLVRLPAQNGTTDYITLADLVAAHAARMYRGYDILSESAFRVTRNSNLYLQEEESRNVLESVRTELHNRRKGDAVRLEIGADASAEISDRLRANFDLQEWQVYRTEAPVNLSRLMHLYDESDRPELKFKPFTPRELHLSRGSHDLFDEIRRGDILLHHPYDSYDAVVSFLEAAAEDANVLSMKQTLYRTSEHSSVMQALLTAAGNKEVTVVVELKARFDEAPNIRWARSLEDAGVQVFYGLVGLKTHCKLALLVRKDSDGVIRRYAHLGTGNYNPATAAFYTDLSLLTADPEITSAVHDVFNFLTAYTDNAEYGPLLVSPLGFAEKSLGLIAREAEHARRGRPARIIVKVNSLLDKTVVQELYRASQAGVEIDLIVRGICSLRPGLRGISNRIRVRSIVGRFLEHSRIFYFANGGEEEIYLGSADWMPRNLYERVEVTFPVKEAMLQQRLRSEILEACLRDTAKARLLRADGSYARPKLAAGAAGFNAQEFLIAVAEGRQNAGDLPEASQHRARSRKAGKLA